MNPWTIIGWMIVGVMALAFLAWCYFGVVVVWDKWLQILDRQRRTIKKIEDHTP